MKQILYTLAIGHLDGPAAELFNSQRAALERRLELAEVSETQRDYLLQRFDAGDVNSYEAALDRLESQVTLVCSIEEHKVSSALADRK